MRQAGELGRVFRGALARHASWSSIRGGGAPSQRNPLAVCVALTLVALLFVAGTASAAETPSYRHSFGPDGTEGSAFEDVSSVAVDQQSGDVYVLDRVARALYKFDAEGNPLDFGGAAPYITENRIDGLTVEAFPTLNQAQVAVDPTSRIVYVTEPTTIKAFEPDGEEAEFTAGPGMGSNEIGGFAGLAGIAVDGDGNIYASDWINGTVSLYTSAGESLNQFTTGTPKTLAVDSKDNVWVHPSEVQPLVKFTPSDIPVASTTTYTATEPIPFAFTDFRSGFGVDSLTGDVFASLSGEEGNRIAQYSESGEVVHEYAVNGKSFSQGLAVVEGGETFYVGADAGMVAIFGQQPPGPPLIASAAAYQVSSDTADLQARINPRKVATTYRFEFGTSDCSLPSSGCTAVPTPDAPIGSGNQPVKVSQPILGLTPGTTYHLRVFAENGEGTDEVNRTFTTQPLSSAFELSDSRVWEMVSPSDKGGGGIVVNKLALLQAAAAGGAVVYKSRGSMEAEPAGNRSPELTSYLASRSATGGWLSRGINAPHFEANVLQGQDEFFRFSTDLSKALFEPRDETPLSSEASEYTPYIRSNTSPPTYTPLLTEANVGSGIHWGGNKAAQRIHATGANPDLSHVTLVSETPLLDGAVSGALYHWTDGTLELVSELPAGEGGGIVEGEIGSGPGSVRHAISDDGARIFWSENGYTQLLDPALYVRNTEADESTRLDVVKSGLGAGKPNPAFQEATPDGRVVFFTDSQQLTADASPDGRDIYRCELSPDASEGCVTLTDISAPIGGSGESANVKDMVPSVSEDGIRAYFVAEGVLDTGPTASGETATPGQPNLYLWEQGQGPRFVATLASGTSIGEGDSSVWGIGETIPTGRVALMSSYGSPDGRYFAFMSRRSLTGYGNDSPRDGAPLEEVFVYDAVSDRLDCASCIPTGAGPVGQLSPGAGDVDSPIDPQELWDGRQVSATLPQAPGRLAAPALRQPRVVHENGRVFFNSFDPLVPADTNGDWDVYQFEPVGTGSCSSLSSGRAVARSGGGCVALISSGAAEGQSAFLEASSTGDDVYFLTRGRLSVSDEDNAVDVYDARVNGVKALKRPVTECSGEACRSAAPPPVGPTPNSESFRGPGNAVHCPKGKRKARRNGKVKCVRKHGKQKKQRRGNGKSGRAHR